MSARAATIDGDDCPPPFVGTTSFLVAVDAHSFAPRPPHRASSSLRGVLERRARRRAAACHLAPRARSAIRFWDSFHRVRVPTSSPPAACTPQVGVYSVCIPTGDTRIKDTINGFLLDMDSSVDVFAAAIKADPNLAGGFNAFGLSQGNNLIRGYIAKSVRPRGSSASSCRVVTSRRPGRAGARVLSVSASGRAGPSVCSSRAGRPDLKNASPRTLARVARPRVKRSL